MRAGVLGMNEYLATFQPHDRTGWGVREPQLGVDIQVNRATVRQRRMPDSLRGGYQPTPRRTLRARTNSKKRDKARSYAKCNRRSASLPNTYGS